ncbi:hypothetical protein WDW89_19050 [Deltaproteobacteria bacterium TL4]
MKCPVCRAPYRENAICSRCKTDLQPLLEIRNNAFLYYNYAVAQARQSEWTQALNTLEQALSLYESQAEFHTLRGKIHAHLHQYKEAHLAWKDALKHNASFPSAQNCLNTLSHLLREMKANPS